MLSLHKMHQKGKPARAGIPPTVILGKNEGQQEVICCSYDHDLVFEVPHNPDWCKMRNGPHVGLVIPLTYKGIAPSTLFASELCHLSWPKPLFESEATVRTTLGLRKPPGVIILPAQRHPSSSTPCATPQTRAAWAGRHWPDLRVFGVVRETRRKPKPV